jgi:hypothetical protein
MTAETHEHTWIVGPHSKREGERNFSHSHESPVRAHHHPCTGPGKFAMQSRLAKFTAKPKGEQFRYIAATPDEQTFDFVFADTYTDGHVAAGIPREEWDAVRAQVVAEIAGEPIPPMPVATARRTGHGVHVVSRGSGPDVPRLRPHRRAEDRPAGLHVLRQATRGSPADQGRLDVPRVARGRSTATRTRSGAV